MAETSHGLKLQAATAIAHISEKDRVMQVILAKMRDGDDHVEVPVELLRSLRTLLRDNAKLLQKMDKKIDDLNNQLFNS